MKKKKVMVGMSGGVDSSAAAALLLDQGYDVYGVTLKLWDAPEACEGIRTRTCCSLEDVEDARAVAFKLGIPFYVLNMKQLFEDKVVNYFVDSYLAGETPNPCVACNQYVKFQAMLGKAMALDMDYIATGHYARVVYDEKTGRYNLKKALDLSKDQSYVLYMLKQNQLERLLLPLGEYKKAEIREIAQSKGLVNARKPDSQDICFVRDGNYIDFIKEYKGIEIPEGTFIDKQGNELGKNKGMASYTIGQRKGLGISFSEPKYVISKDSKANTVTLGTKEEAMVTGLIARDMNYILYDRPDREMNALAKTRYSQQEFPVRLIALDDDKARIVFDKPQPFAAPGQSVVLYEGDSVACGGIISETF
ncbi:MAG: tRNA 2-thiouridine(34) synthase MnmA [Clostridiaceae bacterium]|jgi:tRNA-specific 2-thiouridylase|nr:tRNA 2-thiouridine(34) synthase MnmA [Clostridiaceae bacterium]